MTDKERLKAFQMFEEYINTIAKDDLSWDEWRDLERKVSLENRNLLVRINKGIKLSLKEKKELNKEVIILVETLKNDEKLMEVLRKWKSVSLESKLTFLERLAERFRANLNQGPTKNDKVTIILDGKMKPEASMEKFVNNLYIQKKYLQKDGSWMDVLRLFAHEYHHHLQKKSEDPLIRFNRHYTVDLFSSDYDDFVEKGYRDQKTEQETFFIEDRLKEMLSNGFLDDPKKRNSAKTGKDF